MYIVDFLRSRGVWYESLLHRPASSSTKRAGCVHVTGSQGCEGRACQGRRFVRAGCLAIDIADRPGPFERGSSESPLAVRLATPDELFEIFPNCEPGVVPPFGRLYGLKTFVDSGLADSSEIIVGANTRHEGLRMLFRDFQSAGGTGSGPPLLARSPRARSNERPRGESENVGRVERRTGRRC